MRVLVTGGGGFLGQYVVQRLVERDDTVRVFCRNRYERLDELGVETVQGDVRDEQAVAAACEDVDAVFHIAGVPGLWGPWKLFHDVNTLGTQHVLAGCREHGVRKLVYTSSPSVVFDGEPHENETELLPYPDEWLSRYSHSKALAEQAVLAANGDDLATCALRPHLIWGPGDNQLVPRLFRKAKSRRLRRVGPGHNRVSPVYVENAADAHLQAMDALEPHSKVSGEAYFVCDEPVHLWDWIDRLLGLAGLPPVSKSVSLKTAVNVGAACEGLYRLLHLSSEPPMTRFLALQLGQDHTYDNSKAKRDFGYRTTVDFEEALRRTEPDLKRLAAE